MAVEARDLTGLFTDKDELQRLMTEQNEKMGFIRVAGVTAEMARTRMLAEEVRLEENEATRELKQARDESNWEAN